MVVSRRDLVVVDVGAAGSSPAEPTSGPAERAQRLFADAYLGLVRLAAAALRDLDSAEDVVQDAFARVQPKLNRLDDHEQALAYLTRSVINGARSELRRRTVRQSHQMSSRPDDAPAAESAALKQMGRSGLLAAIAGLPNRQRSVVLLRFVHDLSIADTARTLRISQGAVKASQWRAVENLRRALGEEER